MCPRLLYIEGTSRPPSDAELPTNFRRRAARRQLTATSATSCTLDWDSRRIELERVNRDPLPGMSETKGSTRV